MDGHSTPTRWRQGEEGFSLVELLSILLRYRYVIIGVPILLATIVVGWTLLKPRTYTATVQFIAQGREASVSSLAGLASQLGVSIPATAQAESPDFYAALIGSRQILMSAVTERYRIQEGDDVRVGTLVDLFEVEAPTEPLERELALETLEDRIATSIGRATGIIRFDVTTEDPQLSHAIADVILGRLIAFDVEIRQTQAKAETEFSGARVAEAREQLRQAENELIRFQQQNARFSAPELAMERERLSRAVSMRQQIFTELAVSFEKAKIEEVRTTPAVTVLQPPATPVRPDRRGTVLRGIVSLIVGGLLGLLLALVLGFTRRDRSQQPDRYRELEQLREDTLKDLWRPMAWVRRKVATR